MAQQTARHHLKSYLSEFMCRQESKADGKDFYDWLLEKITSLYPPKIGCTIERQRILGQRALGQLRHGPAASWANALGANRAVVHFPRIPIF